MSRLLSRFNFKIERLETDDAALIGNALVSPLYNLDFTSPQAFDDFNDSMFVLNGPGKALGLTLTRQVRLLPFRVARRADRLISRLTRGRHSDHLYLLAAKVG
jgi:hypothetical protein